MVSNKSEDPKCLSHLMCAAKDGKCEERATKGCAYVICVHFGDDNQILNG